MKSVAGTDQPRILKALYFLGLIEASGKPTARFERMRSAEGDDLNAIWVEALKGAYPKLFNGFDLASATQLLIEERFREEFGLQGDGLRKAVSFFLNLARTVGIPLSPYVKQTRQRGRQPGGIKRASGKGRRREKGRIGASDQPDDDQDDESDEGSPRNERLHPAVQAWIDEMPAKDESWTEDDFAEWLTILEASIRRAYKLPKEKAHH